MSLLQADLCFVCACAELCDAAADCVACPSLLHEFVETAYLLPLFINVEHYLINGLKELPLDLDHVAIGCLKVFHDAMLSPHPLHTRLTSCACLLRLWTVETASSEHHMPFNDWLSQAGVISDTCGCLQAGLKVHFFAVASWQVYIRSPCCWIVGHKYKCLQSLLCQHAALAAQIL